MTGNSEWIEDKVTAMLADLRRSGFWDSGIDEARHLQRTYFIAYAMTSGGWDIVDSFAATDDADANAYAEEHFNGDEWYVLDSTGRNINGGSNQS